MARFVELVVLMLPAYAANMAPPFVRFWPARNRPISERWLGTHKTIMGIVFAIVAAIVMALILSQLQRNPGWNLELIDDGAWVSLGLQLGSAAMAGDLIKSFFKRRLNIAPGAPWIPFDQLDFVVAALVVLSFWTSLSIADVVVVLAFSFVADISVNQIAFRLHIRRTAW